MTSNVLSCDRVSRYGSTPRCRGSRTFATSRISSGNEFNMELHGLEDYQNEYEVHE